MHLLRNCLERARAALGAARDRRGAASSAPTRAQAHAPRDRRARGGRGRARVIPARARSLRSEGPARRARVERWSLSSEAGPRRADAGRGGSLRRRRAPQVKLVGDIHGQYADLLRVFDECGGPGLRGNRRLGRGVPTKLQNSRARSNRSRFGRFVNESFSRRVLHGERRELRRNGRIRVEVMSKIWFWRRPRRRPLPLPRRLR